MADYVQIGVSLNPLQVERLQALGEKQGTSFSETIRNVLNIALPFAENGHRLDFARILTIVEFTSLALDTLITVHAPEESDRLLDLAVENLRTFHASAG